MRMFNHFTKNSRICKRSLYWRGQGTWDGCFSHDSSFLGRRCHAAVSCMKSSTSSAKYLGGRDTFEIEALLCISFNLGAKRKLSASNSACLWCTPMATGHFPPSSFPSLEITRQESSWGWVKQPWLCTRLSNPFPEADRVFRWYWLVFIPWLNKENFENAFYLPVENAVAVISDLISKSSWRGE